MSDNILVTGGAGFIGSTLVRDLLERGDRVVVLDDLSRAGSLERAGALGGLPVPPTFLRGDVADRDKVEATFATHGPFDAVFHLAAQVAVTWAMQDPHRDFLINATGSFHVIDAVRRHCPAAVCVYMSSNKVYGALDWLPVEQRDGRWCLVDLPHGLAEDAPFDPETPYGVSKATGEAYFRDAARTFGIPTVCLRASCIYGPRQSQQEDQGWVAWFAQQVAAGEPIRIFGDGLTTRDMLFVDDLIALYLAILDGPPPERGLVLNVGGGPSAARSLLEVVHLLESLTGKQARYTHVDERPRDQRAFVTDIRLARRVYGWQPEVGPEQGLARLLSS